MESIDLNQFRAVLQIPGERVAAAYIKDHPHVLYWTMCPASGHDRFVFFEFPLGSQHVADALILNSYSGAWEATLIEFEPVGDQVFTKAGTPSRRLAGALKQVEDWDEYIRLNGDLVRRDLVRWASKHDKLGYSDGDDPSNFSGDKLADARSLILYKYVIVIGRSSNMSQDRRWLAGRSARHHSSEIVSYDRFFHLAQRRYGNTPSA